MQLPAPDRPVSAALHARAREALAAGVSSDARRPAPGQTPLYVERASGAHLWDVDGNRFVDYVLGQGPMVLGHCPPEVVRAVADQAATGFAYAAQHELEVRAAELVQSLVPCADFVRFNTVGSEAVLGAWRIARGVTGRQRILKFEGHYHGWLDAALWSLHPDPSLAGPRDHPVAVPGTGGQQLSSGGDLVLAPWNDLAAFEAVMDAHGHEVAAVVMEPVLCNTGCIEPVDGFLEGVMARARADGALVVFDEVITGFRLAPGGAQEYLGLVPDLAVFGKAIAGGIPVAAIAGRAEVMDAVTAGRVSHAGTFNSNPIGMAAAVTTLRLLHERRDEVYPQMYRLGRRLMEGIRERAAAAGVSILVDGPGPVFQTCFTDRPAVLDYRDFAATDKVAAARFHAELTARGVNVVPRGLWFLSAAHTDEDVESTLAAVEDVLRGW